MVNMQLMRQFIQKAEAIRKMVINNEMLVNVMKKAGKECML